MQTETKQTHTAQFTPGPWNISHYHASCEISAQGRIIATVNRNWRDDEEGNANAALVGASPDLYEACKAALLEITNHESGHCKQFQDVEKQLQSALAKAEGRQE